MLKLSPASLVFCVAVTAQDLSPNPRKGAAKRSTLTIKGTLRYQACDDTTCYLPTTVPAEWTIKPLPLQ
jgi:hypothetical protein